MHKFDEVCLTPVLPRHVWTVPVWQEAFGGFGIESGAVMYPSCLCGLLTAGPDGYRGSGFLALRRAFYPRRRNGVSQPRRLNLLPSLPSAPCLRPAGASGRNLVEPSILGVHRKQTARERALLKRRSERAVCFARLISFPRDQDRPSDARGFRGLREDRDLHRPPAQNAALPFTGAIRARPCVAHDRTGAERKELAQAYIALPADALCAPFGPARMLPWSEPAPSGEVSRRIKLLARADRRAVKPPAPGMVASRRNAGSPLAIARIFFSSAAIISSSASACASSMRSAAARTSGMRSSREVSSAASSAKPRRPCAATLPSSASWLRMQFMSCVCCLTRRSRDRSRPREACCATLLIATKRMFGRERAVPIAAASRASFLLRLTKGFT